VIVEQSKKIHLVRLLSEELCEQVTQDHLLSAHWRTGELYRAGDVSQEDMRRCSVIFENNAPTCLIAGFNGLRKALKPLRKKNGKDVLKISTLQLVRYEVGESFGEHRDAVPRSADWRRHSIVCYMNDDFVGGETYFPTLDLDVPPRKGHGLIFPSHYLHGSRSVMSGSKYVMVGFMVDLDAEE
jgi:hypothetical protein